MSNDNNDYVHIASRGRSEWYEKRRNELVDIFDDALKLDISENYKNEIRNVLKKIHENTFEFTLVGEFQCGKSTTFNALCDGRDISPRGSGSFNTSATVISAQNISDNETKEGLFEWAEITYKSSSDLLLGMAKILRPILLKDEEFRNDEQNTVLLASDIGFCELLDLRNAEHRAALQRATEILWNKIKEDKKSSNARTTEDADNAEKQLRVVMLQLRYFGTPEYSRLIEKHILPITEFQSLVAYPPKWELRWGSEGDSAAFSFEESACFFVKSVLVRIHSDNLARLGCRITDCPGLFANAYDNDIARSTFTKSDGIWCLIRGEKQVSSTMLDIFGEIKNLGMLERTSATLNLRGHHEQKIRDIVPSAKKWLEGKGCPLEVIPYNAHLAYLSALGNLLVNHPTKFGTLELAKLKKESKNENTEVSNEEMWCKTVRTAGTRSALTDLKGINVLDNVAVDKVFNESLMDNVIEAIAQKGIINKAHSILIANGSNRVLASLKSYDEFLAAKEKNSETSVAGGMAKVQKAKAELEDYTNALKETIDDSQLVTLKHTIAKMFSEEVFKHAISNDFIDCASLDMAMSIINLINREGLISNKSIQEKAPYELTPLFEKLFKDSMVRVLASLDSFESFYLVKQNLNQLNKDIRRLWDSKTINEELFNGMEVPLVNEDNLKDWGFQILNDATISNVLRPFISENKNLIRGIKNSTLLDLFLKGMLEVSESVFRTLPNNEGVVMFAASLKQQVEERRNNKTKSNGMKLVPEFRKALHDLFDKRSLGEEFCRTVSKRFIEMLDKCILDLTNASNALRTDFYETRCKPFEEYLKMAQADRQRIAQETNNVRTNQLKPLFERIRTFEEKVKKELA